MSAVATRSQQRSRFHAVSGLDADASLPQVGNKRKLAVTMVEKHIIAQRLLGVHHTRQVVLKFSGRCDYQARTRSVNRLAKTIIIVVTLSRPVERLPILQDEKVIGKTLVGNDRGILALRRHVS